MPGQPQPQPTRPPEGLPILTRPPKPRGLDDYGYTDMTQGELVNVAHELGWPVAETMWTENTGTIRERVIEIRNRAALARRSTVAA